MRFNICEIEKGLEKGTKLLSVVKANGYGQGLAEISKTIEDLVAGFCVATINEGLTLRTFTDKQVLVLSPFDPLGLESAIQKDLELTVFLKSQLTDIERTAKKLGRQAKVQLKLNTGMNRFGINARGKFLDLANRCDKSKNIKITGVFSHLSARNEEFSRHQKETFEKILKDIPFPTHISASYGTCLGKDFHKDFVRVGIIQYGLDNFGLFPNLKPTFSLESRVVATQNVKRGDYVGYGDGFLASTDCRIGVVRGGYGDGINRLLSGKGYVIIKNKKLPIVGNVCMDCFFVLGNVKVGDEVTILNAGNIYEMSKTLKTIPYEVLTNLSERVTRSLV